MSTAVRLMTQSRAASCLQSALTLDSPLTPTEGVSDWLADYRQQHRFQVRPIPFGELDRWAFANDPTRLVHDTGRFFSVEGLVAHSGSGRWTQPIIDQPEIGILGILTHVIDDTRYFLMQAKMEPGNPNLVQLSPTVQATKSNYTQAHGGRLPAYLEYFLNFRKRDVIVDQLQSEQGSLFLQKRNRNIVIDVTEPVELHDGFCWLTLGQLKQLLRMDNIVNMDSRSVLSCIRFADPTWQQTEREMGDFGRKLLQSLAEPQARYSMDAVLSWYTHIKTHCELERTRVGLDQLDDWEVTDSSIQHKYVPHLNVMAVAVQAGSREVAHWTQPLVASDTKGIIGFVSQEVDGQLHFLVQARVEPGNRDLIELSPTVISQHPDYEAQRKDRSPYLDYFRCAHPATIRHSSVQSEEGGRFYLLENNYMVVELPAGEIDTLPPDYLWLTLRQVMDLNRYGFCNVEMRNLLACLSFDEDITPRMSIEMLDNKPVGLVL